MKVILIGYPGSQCIVPASKYLTSKYLPGFDITYLNYKGEINGWASYIQGFLQYLTDPYIIFALDDYLLAGSNLNASFYKALIEVGGEVACVKLFNCTPEEHDEYPVTTQYTVWDREYLIYILNHVRTPWEFEIKGSACFKTYGRKILLRPYLEYFTNSSISARWEGVRLDGLKQEDIDYIKYNNLIKENGLHITGTLKPNEKYNGFI